MERPKNRSARGPHKLVRPWTLAFAVVLTMTGLASAPVGALADVKLKAPQNVTVGALTEHTIQLSWKDASNNESGFEIDDGETRKTIKANATSYLWVGSPYKRVCFRVRAVGEFDASASKPASDWMPKESEPRCARTPTEGEENFLAFPLAAGIKAAGGAKGLHGDQYSAIKNNAGEVLYTMENPTSKYALDFVPKDAYNYPDPKITYPVFSMEDGIVQSLSAKCDEVVVDGGDSLDGDQATTKPKKPIWILYMHVNPDPALQVGQQVDTNTRLGTLVVSPERGGKQPPCQQSIPVDNVHVSLLTPTGPKTAKYLTFVGQSLCGHAVVGFHTKARYGNGFNMLLDGLTRGTAGDFTVPAC
jgi:hypothetical protein